MDKITRKEEQINSVRIRPMTEFDIDDVMTIEKSSFSLPWSEEIFYREIRENSYAYYFVLIYEQKTVGYGGLWIIVNDAQITNIALLPEYRGKQLGEKLLHYLLQYAKSVGVERLSLEVRTSNIIAQRLYRKMGFVPGGIHKNYYTDNQEDAIIMWVNL